MTFLHNLLTLSIVWFISLSLHSYGMERDDHVEDADITNLLHLLDSCSLPDSSPLSLAMASPHLDRLSDPDSNPEEDHLNSNHPQGPDLTEPSKNQSTPRSTVNPRRTLLTSGQFVDIHKFEDVFFLEKGPSPAVNMAKLPTNLEASAIVNATDSCEPLKDTIIFMALECLCYVGPTDDALERLRELDKTDYYDPETLIRIMGINDPETKQKIRTTSQRVHYLTEVEPATVDCEEDPSSLEDDLGGPKYTPGKEKGKKKLIAAVSKVKSTIAAQSIRAKRFSQGLTRDLKMKVKRDNGKERKSDLVEPCKPDDLQQTASPADIRDCRRLIERARSTWVFLTQKKLEEENADFFQQLRDITHLPFLKILETNTNAKIPTQYVPVEEELFWCMTKLRAMGATLIVYSPQAYDSEIEDLMKTIGIVPAEACPKDSYCLSHVDQKIPGIIEFLRASRNFSQIVLIDNLYTNLGSYSRDIKPLYPEARVDVIYYKRMLSLTTPPLIALQHEAIKKYAT